MWASGPDEKAPEAQAINVVSYLLDAGARIDDRDARGRTALMIAAEGGRAEIANLLIHLSRTRPENVPQISRCCLRCVNG
jgi:ankyrin repeat protein